MKGLYFIFLLTIFSIHLNCTGQGRNANWCFGDSAGLNFSGNIVTSFNTVLQSNEPSACISDTSGNLLFYVGSTGSNNYARVYNFSNQLFFNGDSILSNISCTQGLLIIPTSLDTSKYLLFSTGNTPSTIARLYRSIIDVITDSVVSKNILVDIVHSYSEKLLAIRHANGRDWWLIMHELNTNQWAGI